MKITRIAYRALENTGNYCSQALEMEAVLHEGDDLDECFYSLVDRVKRSLKEAIEYVPQNDPEPATTAPDLEDEDHPF